MKGLKKIALCSAVALAPFAANADLKALNDSAMSDVTGQAGVTIDINSATVGIGEIAYQDQGFLALSGIELGGSGIAGGTGGNALDDIRLTIDVAGTTEDLGIANRATTYMQGAGAAAVAAAPAGSGVDGYGGVVSNDVDVTDGDLVIALRSKSGTPVDFGLSIDEVSLNAQANAADLGDFVNSSSKGTVLVSGLDVYGEIGPIDIVVDGQTNKLNINAFFNAQGSMKLDFVGTSLGFELHNRRGTSTVDLGTTSFAHAQVEVGVAEDYFAADQDALGVNVQDFSGDLDLTNITMGNGASIGSVFMTDLAVTAEMVIYGH